MAQYFKCPYCGNDVWKNISEAREHIRNCPKRNSGETIEILPDAPKGNISIINVLDPVEIALNKNECPECKHIGKSKEEYTFENPRLLGLHRWHKHQVKSARKKKNKKVKSQVNTPEPIISTIEIPTVTGAGVHVCMACNIVWDFSDDFEYCPRCSGVTIKMIKKQLRCGEI